MKVLLGIGGSDDSFRALETVAERTVETGDDLTVAVVENPASDRSPDHIERRVREVLEAAGLDAAIHRLEGHAGSRLVELAEHDGYDAVALGGGKRSPMGKITLGQIAEFVLLNADVTVILVR